MQAEAPALVLMREVYEHVEQAVETFEDEDRIGPDLAYLLGAILHDSYCEWPAARKIVELLRLGFPADHAVWQHAKIEE